MLVSRCRVPLVGLVQLTAAVVAAAAGKHHDRVVDGPHPDVRSRPRQGRSWGAAQIDSDIKPKAVGAGGVVRARRADPRMTSVLRQPSSAPPTVHGSRYPRHMRPEALSRKEIPRNRPSGTMPMGDGPVRKSRATEASAGSGSNDRPRGTLMSTPCTSTSAKGSRDPWGGGLHRLSASRCRSAAISAPVVVLHAEQADQLRQRYRQFAWLAAQSPEARQ